MASWSITELAKYLIFKGIFLLSIESTDQQKRLCNRGLMGLTHFLYIIPKSFKTHDLLLPASHFVSVLGFKISSPLCIAAAALNGWSDSFYLSSMLLCFNSKPFPTADFLLVFKLFLFMTSLGKMHNV